MYVFYTFVSYFNVDTYLNSINSNIPLCFFFFNIVSFSIYNTAVQCPQPLVPINGRIDGTSGSASHRRYAVGALVTFSCTEGHLLVGEASIVCTETGFWSHPPPFCKYIILLLYTTNTSILYLYQVYRYCYGSQLFLFYFLSICWKIIRKFSLIFICV